VNVNARAAIYWWRNYYLIKGEEKPTATDEGLRMAGEAWDTMEAEVKQLRIENEELSRGGVHWWYAQRNLAKLLGVAKLTDCATEIEKLKEEASLPRTVDGEVITPGMTVFFFCWESVNDDVVVQFEPDYMGGMVLLSHGGKYRPRDLYANHRTASADLPRKPLRRSPNNGNAGLWGYPE
jgi:hypothetical protein